MTYSIALHGADDMKEGEVDEFFLCSIGAWGEVVNWVDLLPKRKFPLLHTLVQEGEVRNTEGVRAELLSGLKLKPVPPRTGLRATLKVILSYLDPGDPTEFVSIVE